MFELGLNFMTGVNLLRFLFLAMLGGGWAYFCLKKKAQWMFLPVIMVNFLILILWSLSNRIYHDEVAHLHLSWLIDQGLVPFKDFWSHHPPFLWVIMASFIKWFKPTLSIFVFCRFFSAIVFLINAFVGWKIAKAVWKDNANPFIYILVLSSVIVSGQFLLLRPDIFMVFFLLAGIYICLEIPDRSPVACFLAGVAFSIAWSFLIKQYLLVFLPLIAIFLGARNRRFLRLTVYLIGLLIGGVPLFIYLVSHQVFQEFVFWVFGFNRQILQVFMGFPVAVFALGCWGAYLLLSGYRRYHDKKSLILFFAFLLSTLSSLTSTLYANGGYYLAFWFIISAIVSSGCPVPEILKNNRFLSQRVVMAGIFLSLMVVPNILPLELAFRKTYKDDKTTFLEINRYCSQESCFVLFPLSPVFAPDATRFYSYSQYLFLDDFPCVREDILRTDFVKEIIRKRPAVVTCRFLKRDFFLDLVDKKLVSPSGYKELTVFFKENYRQVEIGNGSYYIRNDKF